MTADTAIRLPEPWSAAPCALVCKCGASHVVAIDNVITTRQRAQTLKQSAAVLGWYVVDGDWTCPPCYGSALLDAVMQQRAGNGKRRRELDNAADERVMWMAWGPR